MLTFKRRFHNFMSRGAVILGLGLLCSLKVEAQPSPNNCAFQSGQCIAGKLVVNGDAGINGNLFVSGTFNIGDAGSISINSHNGIFNVLDYGAACNGTTDDTTAIQAALTAAGNAASGAGGATVQLPPLSGSNFCLISNANGLTIPSFVTLKGGYSTGPGSPNIRCTPSTRSQGCLNVDGTNGVIIDGISLAPIVANCALGAGFGIGNIEVGTGASNLIVRNSAAGYINCGFAYGVRLNGGNFIDFFNDSFQSNAFGQEFDNDTQVHIHGGLYSNASTPTTDTGAPAGNLSFNTTGAGGNTRSVMIENVTFDEASSGGNILVLCGLSVATPSGGPGCHGISVMNSMLWTAGTSGGTTAYTILMGNGVAGQSDDLSVAGLTLEPFGWENINGGSSPTIIKLQTGLTNSSLTNVLVRNGAYGATPLTIVDNSACTSFWDVSGQPNKSCRSGSANNPGSFTTSQLSTPAALTFGGLAGSATFEGSYQGVAGILNKNQQYCYRDSLVDGLGQTLASTEACQTTPNSGANDWNIAVVLPFGQVGAISHKIYCGATGAEALCATVPASAFFWIDSGVGHPGGALPGSNTTGATSQTGIALNGSTVRANFDTPIDFYSAQTTGSGLLHQLTMTNAGTFRSATYVTDVTGVGAGNFVTKVCLDGASCAAGNTAWTCTVACASTADTATACSAGSATGWTAGATISWSIATACGTTNQVGGIDLGNTEP